MFLTLSVSVSVWGAEVTFLPNELTPVTSQDYSHTKENVTIAVTASTVTTEEFRIFKNQTITITSTGGAITNIKFTCTANNTTKYGPGCLTVEEGNYSYSDNVGTWTGSATEIIFTASTNQVRATEIVVTYGSSCDKIVTVQAGKPIQGASFQLDKTGEQECCDDLTVTVSDIVTPSGYQFSAITQTGINSGVTIDQTNKIVTYAQNTSGTSTINVTFTALVTHPVSWKVNGEDYSVGDPTTQVYDGGKVTKLPTAPDPANNCGEVFAGWTTIPIDGTTNTKPSVLFTTVEDSPNITEPTTFYAVFADYAD